MSTYFKNYLKASGQTSETYARKLGVSQSHFSELVNFKKGMSLQNAFMIEADTKGAIPWTYWLGPDSAIETNEGGRVPAAVKRKIVSEMNKRGKQNG